MLLSILPHMALGQAAASQAIPGEEIVDCAQSILSMRSAGLEGKVEWASVSIVAASQVPAGKYKLRAEEIRGQWPRHRVGVPVRIWMEGREVQSRVVWFSVHWWKEAMVYAKAAQSGDAAESASVQKQIVDVVGIESLDSQSPSWLQGKRFRRSVRIGQPMHKSDFEPAPVVARNSKVNVAVEVGSVRLATTGIATEEGAVNDVINVRPEGTERSVKARIVARNEVQIER